MSDPNTNITEKPAAGPAAPAAPAAPAKPAPPPKPSPPAKAPAKAKGRRFFLLSLFGSWFAVAWVALTASLAGMVLYTLRFLVPNVTSEPSPTFKAGDPSQYALGEVVAFKDKGAWVVRSRDE